MNKFTWLVLNSAFAYAIWMAFWQDSENAARVVMFIAWVTIISALLVAFTPEAVALTRQRGRSVPFVFDWLFDFAVMCILVWFGWVITGVFYAIQIACVSYIYDSEGE